MSMDKEIDVAVELVCMGLRKRVASEVVARFGAALGEGMRTKYSGHWYPDKPNLGTGYRCLRLNSNEFDPLLAEAGLKVGLSVSSLGRMLPCELTIWVDPGVTSYRFGEEEGSICDLYNVNAPMQDEPTQLSIRQQNKSPRKEVSSSQSSEKFTRSTVESSSSALPDTSSSTSPSSRRSSVTEASSRLHSSCRQQMDAVAGGASKGRRRAPSRNRRVPLVCSY